MQTVISLIGKYRLFWRNSRKLLVLAIGAMVMLLGLAPVAWAEVQVVTIYFGGTGLPETAWMDGESRWETPNLIATLHQNHLACAANQHKFFVPGVGAKPACSTGTIQLSQQKDPHDNICRNWDRTVKDAEDFLEERIAELVIGDWMKVNIISHSRGAIAAMWFLDRMVNEIDNTEPYSIKTINLITLDPVPGTKLT